MIKFSVLYILMLFPSIAFSQGFRNYPWGTDLETILAKEPDQPEGYNKYSTSLFYRSVPISGDIYTIAIFTFDKNLLLIKGSYGLDVNRSTDQEWNRLLKVLNLKYGRAREVSTHTKNVHHTEFHWQSKDTHVMTVDDVHSYKHYRDIIYYSLSEWNKIQSKEALKVKNKPITDRQGL